MQGVPEPERSKAAAVARMYFLGGVPAEPLGPGSKEKKSALNALGLFVGLDLADIATKTECGRQIALRAGVEWSPDCYSTGDTITLVGLNRILGGAMALERSGSPSSHAVLANEMKSLYSQTQPQTTEDREMPLETDEVQQNIAEKLALLSERSELPAGVQVRSEPFEADAVRFGDGSWRSFLSHVQDWLKLADSLDESSPEAFDASVGRGLDLLQAESADGDVLLQRLYERLERAAALRDEFLSAVEEAEGAGSHASASKAWAEAWEEALEERENEGAGPIHALAETWPISQFVQHANDGELNLSPSYQRADVWPTVDAQLLVESILRGIPLPSVILLQSEKDGLPHYEAVDGKQRLTSILRFVGRHPKAVALVEKKAREWDDPTAVDLFQRNYPEFKKLWKKNETQRLTATVERELYFPFALRGGEVRPLSGKLKEVRGKYYSEIRDHVIDIVGEARKVQHVFEQQSAYKVPVIVYNKATSEQVHDVFSLYNKQGKHLNAEEIRNALYHQLDLMRGLLVTAGDSEDVEVVAPFLVDVWPTVSSTGANLDGYGFKRSGYKRTKLLSWIASVMFMDEGSPERRSTASQINTFFKLVKDGAKPEHRALRRPEAVTQAMVLIDRGVSVHAGIPDEVWAPKFKNSLGRGKWQELQLVATFIALTAAASVHGDDLEVLVEEKLDEISARSSSWARPTKTQSKEQWVFIAGVVRDFLEVLETDADDVDAALRATFGTSGLKALTQISATPALV